MNLCINCKHHTVYRESGHGCLLTKQTTTDPVTGTEEVTMSPCQVERMAGGRCGLEVARFEPRTEPTVDDLCKK